MKAKTKKNTVGDFCDLCKKKNKDGYTFVEIDYPKHHELAFCQSCRRYILIKLFEQYMLEADMQSLCNDMLGWRINNLRDLMLKHIGAENKNGIQTPKHRRNNKSA